MNNAVVRGQWMNDSDSDSCLSCAKSFDMFVWRHHCRRCGGLFCEACSLRKLHIPEAMLVNMTSSSSFYKPDVSAYNRCCDSCAVIVENYNDLQQLNASQSDSMTINSGGTGDALLGVVITAEPAISPSSLLTSPPTLSCSSEKTETQSNTASSSALSLPRSALREVACEEWKGGAMGGGKHKSYSITVPQYLSSERKFLVSLDERIMTIILPVDIMPGEMISVKAPSPSTSIRRAVASTVLTHFKKDGLVSCPACSFDNPIELLNCQMCRALISFDPFRTHLPAATVLEMSAEDVPKRYVIQVPSGVRPDDVFELVLDLRPFSVICPMDAEGGNNIAVTAPAVPVPAISASLGISDLKEDDPVPPAAIASVNEAVKLAGMVEIGNDKIVNVSGTAPLLRIPACNISQIGSFDTGAVTSSDGTSAPSIPSVASTKEIVAPDAVNKRFVVTEELVSSNDALSSAGLEASSTSEFSDTEGVCTAIKSDTDSTQGHDVMVSDRHDALEACATARNSSPCNTHLLDMKSTSGLIVGRLALDVSSTPQGESKEGGEAVATSPLRDSAMCPVCALKKDTTALKSPHAVNISLCPGASSLCCACGDDLSGNISTPVAVQIPLATPSMTVISSIRDAEVPPSIALQSRPLHSHTAPWRCDGRFDESSSSSSSSSTSTSSTSGERYWGSSPVIEAPSSSRARCPSGTEGRSSGSEGRSRIGPAIASLYDPAESLSPVNTFASSSYSTSKDDAASDRMTPVRHGHSSSFPLRDDSNAHQEEDVTDIAVVVAEQWVPCVHCAGDNPPNALRCEVCFGNLSGSS